MMHLAGFGSIREYAGEKPHRRDYKYHGPKRGVKHIYGKQFGGYCIVAAAFFSADRAIIIDYIPGEKQHEAAISLSQRLQQKNTSIMLEMKHTAAAGLRFERNPGY